MMADGFRHEKAAEFVAKHQYGPAPRGRPRGRPKQQYGPAPRGRPKQQYGTAPRSRPYSVSHSLSATAATSERLRQHVVSRSSSLMTPTLGPGRQSADIMSSASVGRLSSSTLKQLGLSNHVGGSAATTTTNTRPSLPSSAGAGDGLCHDDLLLTMAKRLNDAAARSSRGTGVGGASGNCDGIETQQHGIDTRQNAIETRQHATDTMVPRSVHGNNRVCDDAELGLRRSLQTDGPPYHDFDEDTDTEQDNVAVDTSTLDTSADVAYYCTDNESDYETCNDDGGDNNDGGDTDNRCHVVADMCQHQPVAVGICGGDRSSTADSRMSANSNNVNSSTLSATSVKQSSLSADTSSTDCHVTMKPLSHFADTPDRDRSIATKQSLSLSTDTSNASSSQSNRRRCQTSKPVNPSSRAVGRPGPDVPSSMYTGVSRLKDSRVVLCDVVKSGFAMIDADGTCHLSAATACTSDPLTGDTGRMKGTDTEQKVNSVSTLSAAAATLLQAAAPSICTTASSDVDVSAESDTETVVMATTSDVEACVCSPTSSVSSTSESDIAKSLSVAESDTDLAAVAKATTSSPSVSATSLASLSSSAESKQTASTKSLYYDYDAGVDTLCTTTDTGDNKSDTGTDDTLCAESDTETVAMATTSDAEASIQSLPAAKCTAGSDALCTTMDTGDNKLDTETDMYTESDTEPVAMATASDAEASIQSLPAAKCTAGSNALCTTMDTGDNKSDMETDVYAESDTEPVAMATTSTSECSLSTVEADGVKLSVVNVSLSSRDDEDSHPATDNNPEKSTSVDDTGDIPQPVSSSVMHSESPVDDTDGKMDDEGDCPLTQVDLDNAAETDTTQQLSSHGLSGISSECETDTLTSEPCGISEPVQTSLGSISSESETKTLPSESCGISEPVQTSLGGISIKSETKTLPSEPLQTSADNQACDAVTECHSDAVSTPGDNADDEDPAASCAEAVSMETGASTPVSEASLSCADAGTVPMSALTDISESTEQKTTLSLREADPHPLLSSSSLSSSSSAALSVSDAASQMPTCHISSLSQLLSSAKNSRPPYFIHVVARSSAAASGGDRVPGSSPVHQSETAVNGLRSLNAEKLALSAHCDVSATSAASSHQVSVVSIRGASRMKRLLLGEEEEPTVKRPRAAGSIDTMPLPVDRIHRATSTSPSVSVSATSPASSSSNAESSAAGASLLSLAGTHHAAGSSSLSLASLRSDGESVYRLARESMGNSCDTVSYTHLTLPTKRIV